MSQATDSLTFGALYELLGAPTTAALQFAHSHAVHIAYLSRGVLCYEDVQLRQLAEYRDCWAGYSPRTNCVYCYIEDKAEA